MTSLYVWNRHLARKQFFDLVERKDLLRFQRLRHMIIGGFQIAADLVGHRNDAHPQSEHRQAKCHRPGLKDQAEGGEQPEQPDHHPCRPQPEKGGLHGLGYLDLAGGQPHDHHKAKDCPDYPHKPCGNWNPPAQPHGLYGRQHAESGKHRCVVPLHRQPPLSSQIARAIL